jgi:hypothetical protein
MPILTDDEIAPAGLAPQLPEPMRVTVPMPPVSPLWDAAMTRENSGWRDARSADDALELFGFGWPSP